MTNSTRSNDADVEPAAGDPGHTPDLRVSAVLITYNQAEFVGQALQSVLGQRVTDAWEVIIADDGSTDGTADAIDRTIAATPTTAIVRRLDSTINNGMQANLRRSLSAAHGRYVALLEGDDFWTDDQKLQRQSELLDADDSLAAVGHTTRMIWEDRRSADDSPEFAQLLPSRRYDLDDVMMRRFPHTSSLMFRRGLVPTTPAWFDGLLMGDWPLCSLLARQGDIEIRPECMSTYRADVGVHSTVDALFQWERTLTVCRRIIRNVELPPQTRRRALSRVLYEFGTTAARNRDYLHALRLFAECAVNKPEIVWQAPTRRIRW